MPCLQGWVFPGIDPQGATRSSARAHLLDDPRRATAHWSLERLRVAATRRVERSGACGAGVVRHLALTGLPSTRGHRTDMRGGDRVERLAFAAASALGLERRSRASR